MKTYTLKNKKYIFLGILILFLTWIGAYYAIENSIILPSPKETLISLNEIVKDKSFYAILLNTLRRTIISFLISLILAVILGIIAALSRGFYYFLSPILALLKTIPTMAIVVLALIWLTNDKAPILIATIIIFPILYEAVINGIQDIDQNLIKMAKVYKVTERNIIRYIYIPNVLKSIFYVFSSALGLSLKVVIGGEVLGQPPNSIGSSIQVEKMQLNTSGVFAWIIILVLISLIIEILSKVFTRILKAWKGEN